MSESNFWRYLNNGMKSYWKADRHEDKLNLGVPDTSYTLACGIHGWMELKFVKQWPKRTDVLKIEHFTTEQREWLIRRAPNTWLFIKIEKDFLLLEGPIGAKLIGRARKELLLYTGTLWTNKIDFKQLYFILGGTEQ